MCTLIYCECVLDDIYEAMDCPGENMPPLPSRQSRTDSTASNKCTDRHGYIKVYHNNMDNSTTTADARESAPRTDSLSGHSELSDAAD